MPLRHELAGLRIDGSSVTPADVDAECDTRKPVNESVIGFDGALEVSFRVLVARPHSLQRNLIDVSRVARRIDLNVLATCLHQIGDNMTLDLDDMVDEVVESLVDIERRFPFEPLSDAVRPKHSDLRGDFGDALRITKFLERKIAHQLEAFRGPSPGDDCRSGFFEILFRPLQWILVKIAIFIIQ